MKIGEEINREVQDVFDSIVDMELRLGLPVDSPTLQ